MYSPIGLVCVLYDLLQVKDEKIVGFFYVVMKYTQ